MTIRSLFKASHRTRLASQMTRIFAGCLVSCIFCVAACGSAHSHPPTARIAADPLYVALDDAYRTPISLDASGSRDPIDDPANEKPLRYLWWLEGSLEGSLDVDDPQAQFAPSPTAAQVILHLPGTHPIAVHLTVADYDDDKTTTTTIIGVTVPN